MTRVPKGPGMHCGIVTAPGSRPRAGVGLSFLCEAVSVMLPIAYSKILVRPGCGPPIEN